MQRHSANLLSTIVRLSGSATGGVSSCCIKPVHTLPSLASWATCQQAVHVQAIRTQSVQAQLKQTPFASLWHRGFAAQAQTRPQYRGQQSRRKIDPSGTQGLYLVAFTVAMVGVTYASVPLYRMFCQATGYGGTVQQGSTGMLEAQSAACFLLISGALFTNQNSAVGPLTAANRTV